MQELLTPLSSGEKELIKQIMQNLIFDTTNLPEKAKEYFEAFFKEFEGDEDINILELHCEMVNNIILFEEIEEMPESLHKLDVHQIMMAQYVLLAMIEKARYPRSRKKLLKKLDNLKLIKSLNLS